MKCLLYCAYLASQIECNLKQQKKILYLLYPHAGRQTGKYFFASSFNSRPVPLQIEITCYKDKKIQYYLGIAMTIASLKRRMATAAKKYPIERENFSFHRK